MFGIHKIRLYILRCLLEYDEIGFEESRPRSSISANLYSYHIDKLKDLKIIYETTKGKYRLTTSGRGFAEGIFAGTNLRKIDIKILIYGKDGDVKIISGRFFNNDVRTHVAATRIVQKKLKCQNPNLQHIGDAYIKISSKEKGVLEHTMSHIFELKNVVDISNVKESLPEDVKKEILFVKNNADGHFFFERDYLID